MKNYNEFIVYTAIKNVPHFDTVVDFGAGIGTLSKIFKNNEIITTLSSEIKQIYPFINEMVDSFYTKECNELIDKAIQSETDKSIFMMYIMMYFGIHLKLETEDMGGDSAQDNVGSNRVMSLLKELETARSERESDPLQDVKPGEGADITDKENTVSPVGSK